MLTELLDVISRHIPETLIYGAVFAFVNGFILLLLGRYSREHESRSTLIAGDLASQKVIADLQAENHELKEKSSERSAEIAEAFDLQTRNLTYKIDQRSQTRVLDGHYFCPRCFPETLTEVILKDGYYRCEKCGRSNQVVIGQ